MTALLAGSPTEQAALTEAVAQRGPRRRRPGRQALRCRRCSTTSAWHAATPATSPVRSRRSRRRSTYAGSGGERRETPIATWMVGWALRLLGRDDEALRIQTALKAELEAEGATDPYVDEEIATLRHFDRFFFFFFFFFLNFPATFPSASASPAP